MELALSTHEVRTYSYEHPHPAVATDIAIFTLEKGRLALMLIRRGAEPYKGRWALPGGFLQPHEDLDTCARRELIEETHVETPLLVQFGVFSAPNRDPRERIISVAYLALLQSDQVIPVAGSDAAAARWFDATDLPSLAFDHAKIVEVALAALRTRLDDTDILLNLMPQRFTLSQLQAAHDAVSGEQSDKRNFRAKILAKCLVRPTDDVERGAHRPAKLYVRA
jgi:8-oxo-dGTP diphosphatase